MTAAIGLKRLAIAAVAVIAAAFVTLVALSFLIPASAVRDAVKAEISTVTGLDPMLGDDVSLSLFPSGSARFRHVKLGDDRTGQPALAADELTARLRYFPLLAGRIEIADVTLVRPVIHVTFSAAGESNWSALIDSLTHALQPNPERPISFSEIGIQDGTIIVHDSDHGDTQRLEHADFQVAWPSISKSFGAAGRFVWHEQPVEASLTLSDFAAALSGNRSGVKVRLTSAPLNLAFDGTGSNKPTLKIEGMLGVEAPSLREALRWTGKSKLPFGGFGRFALRAQSDIGGGSASLSNVNVELDGNSAEGALTVAIDGQRMVQGTLAAEALDLSPYVAGVRLMTKSDNDWDRMPISLDGFDDFNLDLRLSAASIKIGDAHLGHTAVAATLRGGKFDLTVGEAQAFGGVARGSIGIGKADNGAAVASHMQFADVDLENCLGQIFGMHRLQGQGNLSINLDGTGGSVLAVTRTLNGTAALTAQSGAFSGINVEQLLRRLERRPLSGSGDFRSGRTPFDQLAVNLKVVNGVVAVDDVHIDGPTVRLAVSGQASVPARDFDLKGVATLVSNANTDEFDLPFVVQGPWNDPIMLPDAESLIRRSGAAAPLLNSAKSYNASEAVRSVIDQLLTSPPAATPASTQAPKSAQ